MSSSAEKSSGSPFQLEIQTVIYTGIAWAVLSLLFFLWFSISVPGEDRPFWYVISTYVLEQLPFLAAAFLCFRNWRSPQIASGRNVWLGIGLGTLSYFIANLLLAWWEIGLRLSADVSPGDVFFITAYVCLGWGMILAVLPRRLNLEIWQWGIVSAIAAASIALAVWLSFYPPAAAPLETDAAAATLTAEQTAPATATKKTAAVKKAPALKGAAKAASPAPAATDSKAPSADTEKKQLPAWVSSLETQLRPLAEPLSLFYVVCDVFLLIIAATLLLAFWGGRFSQSWRMIAAAAFSLYIADMWLKFAEGYFANYQTGSLLEVFWVFSGVLFAIGAALEYDTSIRSRRGGRKQRA